MNIEEFKQLEKKFETFSFRQNFSSLNKVLYYFSYLGNIFIILFSYFFIKNVTNTIPKLFDGQDVFFSIFIILFMTGYELFKRFTFQQLIESIVKTKKLTSGIIVGILVSILLVAGSFYLGLNGAHRLVNTSDQVQEQTDNKYQYVSDSITNEFKTKIIRVESQIDAIYSAHEGEVLNKKNLAQVKQFANQAKQLELERDSKIKEISLKLNEKTQNKLNRVKSDSLAFVFITFFLELIILIGVGFNGYFSITSYFEMKGVLNNPSYKQLETNNKLLQILYQNGAKKEGEPVIPLNKMKPLVASQRLNISPKEMSDFYTMCEQIGIIDVISPRKKEYKVSLEIAKTLIEKQIIV